MPHPTDNDRDNTNFSLMHPINGSGVRFFEILETFRAYVGCHNFLGILKTKTFPCKHEILQQICSFVS